MTVTEPEPVRLNPRRVRVGDRVELKGQPGVGEIVRDVSVVLHMANGMDMVYKPGKEEAVILPPPPDEVDDIPADIDIPQAVILNEEEGTPPVEP